MIFLFFLLFPPIYDASEFGFGNIKEFSGPSLSMTYQTLFSLSELQSVKIAYNQERYGLCVSHFGTDLYREIMCKGIYRLALENIWLAGELSLLYLSQGEERNPGIDIDFNIGYRWNDYRIYLNAIHPVSYIAGEMLPVELEICSLYENEWNRIGFKVNFLEGWGVGLGFGYLLKFPNFKAGLGLLTNPVIPTAGFSLDIGDIRFTTGFQNHPDLGPSETYTVHYYR